MDRISRGGVRLVFPLEERLMHKGFLWLAFLSIGAPAWASGALVDFDGASRATASEGWLIGEAKLTPEKVLNYWTPEKLRAARPITPIATERDLELAGADMKTLKKPAPAPLFVSSRIVPQAADTAYPYSAVGRLAFNTPGGQASCSAAVIAPRLIITAGHCVHLGSGGQGGFYSNFVFVPSYRNGSGPSGSWAAAAWATTTVWATGGGHVPNARDFAVLELSDSGGHRIAEVTGAFNYLPSHLFPNIVTLIGYPSNIDGTQLMHQVVSQGIGAGGSGTYVFGSDMGTGSSGGPWVQGFGIPGDGQFVAAPNAIVGVTSYLLQGANREGSSVPDASVTAMLNQMCAHRDGNCN